MIRTVERHTRDVIAASYAIPDLPAAVGEVIYNALDAGATSIQLFVSAADASFSVVDNGEGIASDDLYKFIGESFASSRVPVDDHADGNAERGEFYGGRGELLHSIVSLAANVEVESRTADSWTSHRKVFQLGKVTFNARAKDVRSTPGTTVKVRQLFHLLPVRQKNLAGNVTYQVAVTRDIREFLVNLSLIWPSVAFELRFEGSPSQRVTIPAVGSNYDRVAVVFGNALGRELQEVYLDLSDHGYSIQGLFAIIPDEWGAASPGIKQAQSFYQFVFFDRRWIDKYHQRFASTITQKCIASGAGIPIFLLNISLTGGTSLGDQVSESLHAVADLVAQAFMQLGADHHTNLSPEQVKSELLDSDARQSSYDELAVRLDDGPQLVRREMLDAYELPSESYGMYETHDDYDMLEHQANDGMEGYNASPEMKAPVLLFGVGGATSLEFQDAEILPDFVCCECGTTNSTRMYQNLEELSREFAGDFDPSSETRVHEMADPSEVLCPAANTQLRRRHQDGALEAAYDLDGVFFKEGGHYVSSRQLSLTDSTRIWLKQAEPWLSSRHSTNISSPRVLDEEASDRFHDHGRAVTLAAMAEVTCGETDPKLPQSITTSKNSGDEEPTKLRTSSFFGSTKRRVWGLRQRVKLTVNPMRSFTSTVQVQGFHGRTAKKCIKLHKSVLDHVTFVRQVDRKFILVSVKREQDSHEDSDGDLLLCIDQHAADERVRLEKLELELFGIDGRSRNIDIHEHDPALILQVNANERRTMESNDTLLRSWGFDFELCPHSEWASNTGGSTSSWRYLLRTSPKIEKRRANADDFREFVQLLSTTHSYTTLSTLRPPVITRLLHSRACRSAIMFGDYLSVDQCKTLLDELRQCSLPFQCAHGRPSIVPLAEFQDVRVTA